MEDWKLPKEEKKFFYKVHVQYINSGNYCDETWIFVKASSARIAEVYARGLYTNNPIVKYLADVWANETHVFEAD